ncbi:RIB43A-like with coiled-coils protein 2 [Trachymyrmex septentrionalis]|uniref:RIB43A-like with coiled-coils protein 2 n=1 Tax=Trachymyrmex septentrionalis TaxID=34720 RepID=A0A195F2W9_9HYME|nr:PREDICTED: RIB43A-like with coiled-coils protein 2 [Trachymyrmex septentrionalis]XP_018348457.1 PREDICTED: RIB43A-like with coiled-coils protein 2 [Trachymyrmex septentrionalis]KYN34808.1 RIB43A-like with coiled-coils protein 2 [Trachymyrmex septentrionalis]
MFKFQNRATPEDLKLAASIERKRQSEEARKLRIFNPRIRKIGIDKEFLDRQVEEKKQQRELKRAEECQWDEAFIRSSEYAAYLERQQKEERRKINKEIDSFRRFHQRAEDRRDYDLYDPEALKKSLPACVDDKDDNPNWGVASAQKFEGEDRNLPKRLKAQKEQMRWWIQRQKEERGAAEKAQRDSEDAYQEVILSRDKRATTIAQMEEECRRRLNEATAIFNRALADEQQNRRHCEAVQDDEDKKAEIYNHVTGDFLTEAREQAESTRGPHRPLTDRYKGMTTDELKVFRDAQLQQMEELHKIKLEEKRINETWDRVMDSHLRAAYSYDCELNKKKSELNKKIAEENLRLAEQQKQHQEYLNRFVYKHQPTPDFYEQFNKGTR